MTPFGERLRALRAERGVSLTDMARALDVSASYLSALENGHRGRPTWGFVQRVIQYFNVIWDDAEALQKLADLSHPRVVVDTAGLSARATRVANRLSRSIADLSDHDLAALEAVLDKVPRGH